ncbi:MAG TPA: shikimate dehydrogenase [Thermodesulfovibrionales bacterium]|nr:shikimate dehydrogenase [Thermodesulfovibrionales bacterium]
MKISGKTKVIGLFGYPVEHSLSPCMHNAAFAYLNMDYCYVTFPVRPDLLADAVQSIRALRLGGVNITIPHKEKVIPFLDGVSEEVSFIGAVNTVVNNNGFLRGYNTDGRGFMESLSEVGIRCEGRRVLIIGAGGACRAVGYYLSQKVAHLRIFDIDEQRREKVVKDLGSLHGNVTSLKKLDTLHDVDIVINATPLGLKDTDPSPFNTDLLSEPMIVCDLIYRDTALLNAASEKGCRVLNGLGMLLHQGVLAFEIWTGIRPPAEIMRKALQTALP